MVGPDKPRWVDESPEGLRIAWPRDPPGSWAGPIGAGLAGIVGLALFRWWSSGNGWGWSLAPALLVALIAVATPRALRAATRQVVAIDPQRIRVRRQRWGRDVEAWELPLDEVLAVELARQVDGPRERDDPYQLVLWKEGGGTVTLPLPSDDGVELLWLRQRLRRASRRARGLPDADEDDDHSAAAREAVQRLIRQREG